MTTDDVLARMLAGDDDAFAAVYRAVQPGLLRYLSVLVGAGEAEDVAAETWAQVVRDLHRFTGSFDGFRGWVATIGRHRALDLHRSRERRVGEQQVAEPPETPTAGTAEDQALDLVGTSEALRLIATLPPDQAEAVLLRSVLGLDAPTAARVLGKRPGAVRTAAYRGLRTLAARLRDTPPEPDSAPGSEGDAGRV